MGVAKCCCCVSLSVGMVRILTFNCVELAILCSNLSLCWPVALIKLIVLLIFVGVHVGKESNSARVSLFIVYLVATILETLGGVIITLGASLSLRYYLRGGCSETWEKKAVLSQSDSPSLLSSVVNFRTQLL